MNSKETNSRIIGSNVPEAKRLVVFDSIPHSYADWSCGWTVHSCPQQYSGQSYRCAAPKRPIDIGKPTQNSQNPSGERLLDLSQPKDAERAQQRLIELGYLLGTADGLWGPRSRKGLQEFRSAQGLGESDTWDLQTQQKLFSTMAGGLATAAVDSQGSFVGGWGADPEQCRQASRGRPPMTISTRRAEAFGAVCEFVSTQRESTSAWRVQAICAHNGERWSANIRLTLLGDKLTWSSERGTANYVRCVAPARVTTVNGL